MIKESRLTSILNGIGSNQNGGTLSLVKFDSSMKAKQSPNFPEEKVVQPIKDSWDIYFNPRWEDLKGYRRNIARVKINEVLLCNKLVL